MLEAARDLFAAKGFAATTTREIAERATVTEQLLFNHFESKQQLFAAAVVQPFEEFVDSYVAEWEGVSAGDVDSPQLMREYVAGLYALVAEHRALFHAVSADPFGAHVRRVLDRLEALTAELAELHGYNFDPHIAVRIVFAAVMTMALYHEHLLPDRTGDDVIDELATTLVVGLTQR